VVQWCSLRNAPGYCGDCGTVQRVFYFQGRFQPAAGVRRVRKRVFDNLLSIAFIHFSYSILTGHCSIPVAAVIADKIKNGRFQTGKSGISTTPSVKMCGSRINQR